MNDINKLLKSDLVIGMKGKLNNHAVENCESCALGKMHRLPFPKQTQHRSKNILEMIHTDLCGPMQVDSMGGSRYILTFTDDFSRYSVVYFLKQKSEVFSKFVEFVKLVENNSGNCQIKNLNIQAVRSDNGGEYQSNRFTKYCDEKGIARQFTNPYCPEQNGVAERLNRTIVEGARSILSGANLPLRFWAEAVSTVVYLRNRSPTSSLNGLTPYECWFKEKPDVSNLRVFGCVCYVHIPDNTRRKLDPKSYKAVFTGYPEGTKGYKVYNLESGQFRRSRNVLFHENKFHDFNNAEVQNDNELFYFTPNHNISTQSNVDAITNPDVTGAEPVGEPNVNGEPFVEGPSTMPVVGDESIENIEPIVDDEPSVDNESEVVVPVRPVEKPAAKSTFEETFMDQVSKIGSSRIRKPTKRLIADNEENSCLLASLTADLEEPRNFMEATTSKHSKDWTFAMDDEFSSLIKNKTWELVPRPSDKNVIRCRWLYKVKRGADGSINRYKSRLVAQGYSQTEGIDYEEVFAPVARTEAIRSLLSLANSENLEIHQMDVKTAFLHGVLDCDLYMEQPEGYVDPEKPDYVCKLNKGLYGLKQAARCWNATIDKYLVDSGYVKCSGDACIYLKFKDDKFVIMGVYVDDVIPVSNDTEFMISEKRAICEEFEMVDNGEIDYFLGMTIKRDREQRTLSISQPNYIETVLAKFNMSNCNSVATPVESGARYEKRGEDDEPFDIKTYQAAIGCLTYLSTSTRPDIAAAVGMLSKFMGDPAESHWVGVKRIFRYLKGTSNYGLVYVGGDNDELVGYSDSDWAGDVVTRRSTSGYVFQFGRSTISWSSRRQATVAKSSTEAEYVALSMATQEAIWLRRLLDNYGVTIDAATVIHEDNQGAIELSRNPKHHNRTKHIDVSYHFTRERISTKEIDVRYIPTGDNTADIMTKGLGRVAYEKHRDSLGVRGC